MWLIVGLGNPGKKYEFTRHNVGFLAVERFAKSLNAPPLAKQEYKALTSKFRLEGQEVILAEPQTFMNLSGDSVQALCQYYKISPANLAVIHDEVDLPFGEIKVQKNRGHGGHNGIRDIHQKLGTNEYVRFRIGVGRPAHAAQEVASFVLERFSPSEMERLGEILDRCNDGLELLLDHGFDRAATHVNTNQLNIKS